MLENMKLTVHRRVLKYAVQRAMLCACGNILDCRSATLVEEVGRRISIFCPTCLAKHAPHHGRTLTSWGEGEVTWPAKTQDAPVEQLELFQ